MGMTIQTINSRIKRFADLDVGATFRVGADIYIKGAYDLVSWFTQHGQSANPIESQDLWLPPATTAAASAEVTGYEAGEAIDRLRDSLWMVDQVNVPATLTLDLGLVLPLTALYVWDAYGNIGDWRIEHWSGSAWVVNTSGHGISNGEPIPLVTPVTTQQVRFIILGQTSQGFVGVREIGIGKPYTFVPAYALATDDNHLGTDDIVQALKQVPDVATYWAFLADTLPTTASLTFSAAEDLKGILVSDLRQNIRGWTLSFWNGSAWQTAVAGTTIGTALNPYQEFEFPHQVSDQWQLAITAVQDDAYDVFSSVVDSAHNAGLVGANAVEYPSTGSYWEANVSALPAAVDVTFSGLRWVKGIRLSDVLGNVSAFTVEHWNGVAWVVTHTGTTIVNGADIPFASPVQTGRMRLTVDSVSGGTVIQISQWHFLWSTEVRVSVVEFSPALPAPAPLPDFTGFITVANALNLTTNTLTRLEPEDQVEETPTTLIAAANGAASFG